jgi:hypothetical protein
MVSSSLLIGKLPRFAGNAMTIVKKQSVYDIINEVLDAHKIFAPDYNNIATDFWKGNVIDTCKAIFSFCKSNISYKIEGEGRQTTKSPAAMLTSGEGDCKHYAGFIGGVLDAINRKYNAGINWNYRFASYNYLDKTPGHVFIVVKTAGQEIWVDPVLKTFNEKLQPAYFLDKKIKANTMALVRISGTEKPHPLTYLVDDIDYGENPALYMAVQTLIKFGAMNSNATINDKAVLRLQNKVDADTYKSILNAAQLIRQNSLGSIFSSIARVFKKVNLVGPRAAYLSLVAINAFGFATKLHRLLYDNNNNYTKFKDRLKDLWQNKMGGDWTKLLNTINQGQTHKAIIGQDPKLIAAYAAAAATVIAAVSAAISNSRKAGELNFDPKTLNTDPTTGLPYGTPPTSGNGIMQFIQNNPMLLIGGALAYVYFTRKKKAA